MAEIRIERKSGMNWLWVLLGLLLAALIAWWLLGRGDDVADPVADGAVAAPAAVATTEVGTDASALLTDWNALTAASAGDLDGRQVALANAPVVDVVSDKGFWIGDATNRAFVVRGNQSLPSTAPDGAVNTGQAVAIWGRVVRMPTDLRQQSTEWNLRATDREAMGRPGGYVMADSVRIVSR